MSRICQPLGVVLHTNVALVKYKHKKKTFEIACYRNKVVNWRAGVEADLDEVLQTDVIFNNVTRGIRAKAKDLKRAFKTTDKDEICKIILAKGELQISDKERDVALNNKFLDVARIVADKCVHSKTGRPCPVSMVQSLMKKFHFSVKSKQSAKKQALDCIKFLEKKTDIARAKMLILVNISNESLTEVREQLTTLGAEIVSEQKSASGPVGLTCRIHPRIFRKISELASKDGRSRFVGGVEVLEATVKRNQVANLGLDRHDSPATPATSAASSPVSDAGAAAAVQFAAPTLPSAQASRAFVCRRCGGAGFNSRDEYREHFRCDWHRHNCKRSTTKDGPNPLKPLSKLEFLALSKEQLLKIEQQIQSS